jgi:hypothetical protein
VIALLAGAPTVQAALIPGGGKKAADCYVELDVQGATGSPRLACVDGDPACDTDGQCQGVCTFAVGVCLNQTNVAGCVGKTPRKAARSRGATLAVPNPTDAAPVCATPSGVAVPLKGRRQKPGRKRITVSVVVTGRPPRDVDRVTLVCKRRDGECPMTTTTTTTTLPPPDATALFSGNRIAAFSTLDPAVMETPLAVTGLVAGDGLVSIDRRPQNGVLYGLGRNDVAGTVQLYTIHPTAGIAAPVGTPGTFVDASGTLVPVAGARVGMDFNPFVDRIRVVTDTGQSFRMNPNTGGLIDGDLGGAAGAVAGINMDRAINGALTSVDEVAYTNNAVNATVTTLYTLAPTSLCIQNPANAGTQTACQALSPPVASVLGFDIPPGVDVASSNAVASGQGIAVLTLAGQPAEVLARVDLASGAVGSTTPIGPGGIIGLAVQRPAATPMIALRSSPPALLRFTSADPGSVASVTVSGLVAGETLVGIDYRPVGGQLFGLGVDAAIDTGTLYRLDPQTGSATVVGSAGAIALADALGAPVGLPAGGYGFDFDPTVDRIRVVTSSGLNFRTNPLSGVAVDGDPNVAGSQPDGAINGAVGTVDGVAYTNNAHGALTTTLYALDATTDKLYIQNPPNAGTETASLAITLGGAPLDFSAASGFDIPNGVVSGDAASPVSAGAAFAALTVAGTAHLFSLDLVTGAATDLGVIDTGAALDGLAVGQTTLR